MMKNVKTAAYICVAAFTLLLAGCEKHRATCSGTSEKTFLFSNFDQVIVGDNMEVTITKGNVYSVKANGCNEDLADLVAQVQPGRKLSFSYARSVSNRKVMHISITMPELLNLTGSAAAKIIVSGMHIQNMSLHIDLSSAAEANITGTYTDITYRLSGAAKLELHGTTAFLVGNLSSASLLKAYGLATKQTIINASGASKAYVNAQDRLTADASGASIIYYKGSPFPLETTTSGAGKIIKE